MKLHQDDLEMMDYYDGLIITTDDEKLTKAIEGIYNTLIFELEHDDIIRYLKVKVQYLNETHQYKQEWDNIRKLQEGE